MLKNEPYFRGVFAADTLPSEIRPYESGIVNLSPMASPGTHWVAYYNSPSNIAEYFDSFGLTPPLAIRDYLNSRYAITKIQKNPKNIIYNDRQIQFIDSTRCGYFCTYFIKLRNRGASYNQIMKQFRSTPDCFNETIITRV